MSTHETATDHYPKARRIRFAFDAPEALDDRYAVNGNIVFSHLAATLSLAFPPGEDGFVRSVHRFSEEITDPDLKKRVAGFIGQEVVHGREHGRLNERLVREFGYANTPAVVFGWVERLEDIVIDRRRGTIPKNIRKLPLAWTALAEHLTAFIGARILTSGEIQTMLKDSEQRHLMNWHALEELEHKSVAFDVYRSVGGSEILRIGTMWIAIISILPVLSTATIWSIFRTDPYARSQPLRLIREAWEVARGPVFRGGLREMVRYTRLGFHPDDIDTSELCEKWRDRLFGDEGELVNHMR
jgi:predicted metal-dependent hydrolase